LQIEQAVETATQRHWLKSASIAFLDAYLKADEKAKAYLQAGTMHALGKRAHTASAKAQVRCAGTFDGQLLAPRIAAAGNAGISR
jgi:hypothetical protein